MSGRYEIRFSGSGGQGLILAGVIFAEAATIYDKINAVQSQSYGPEARGGASKSEVSISEEVIDFPKATAIDLQLSLPQDRPKHGEDLPFKTKSLRRGQPCAGVDVLVILV